MAVALREGRSVRDEEIIIERPDGTRRNVMPYPVPIRDTAGRIVGIVVMLLDITERKSAEAAVRQLAAIVESSDDAIIGKDLNGIITSWNRGAEILFGYTAAQMIGQPVQRLIPPEQKDEESGILERLRRGEPIRYDETIRRRQDGTLVDVSLSISPIKDAGGRIVGASKIARDISERKRVQHQANFLNERCVSQGRSTFGGTDQLGG
jgi:PAS domain S-box-containing protein